MSLTTYSVTSVEAEEIDLDLNADGNFNTATVYSKTWPFKTSNNALFTIKYTPKMETPMPSIFMVVNLSFRKMKAKIGAKTGIVATMTEARVGLTSVNP